MTALGRQAVGPLPPLGPLAFPQVERPGLYERFWLWVFRLPPFKRLALFFAWLFQFVEDPGPHTFWPRPNPKAIKDIIRRHGAYFLHGPLGSGKTMGALVLGLVLAGEMAKENPDRVIPVLVNLTVFQHRAALFLLWLLYPADVVRRIELRSFSLLDPDVLALLRQRFAVVIADELGYYFEDDKKAVRGVILKALRMARRRKQYWICVNQEMLHSRYRPLFHLRGECSLRFGLLTIAWRGAQDIVDSRKPTKPIGFTRYGLNVVNIAQIYDTWEDLEDIADEQHHDEQQSRRAA